MFCICMLCAVGIVGGLGAASHLEKFAIKDVSVTGVQKLPADALAASIGGVINSEDSWIFSRKNMFLYPRAAIKETLAAEFPRIKNVSVARQSLLAQAVVVTIKEREPFAKWCSMDCLVMDASGFIFATSSDETPKTSYTFQGGLLPNTDIIGQTFLRGRLAEIITLLDSLAAAGFAPQGISIETDRDFTITLEKGPELRASFESDPSDIIRNLQTALEADGMKEKFPSLQYIDLRFGNRVYYK